MQDSLITIFRHLPGHIRAPLERAARFFGADAREIILRAERPVVVECAENRFFLTESGVLTSIYTDPGLLRTDLSDLLSAFRSICEYSVYARQDELNRGYITIENGVRVGLCGTVVKDGEAIVNIKDITTLSFRVATEIPGCADGILDRIRPLDGVLICGPPCSGKTTVIRDMARRLSMRCKVSVIDERNEISATFAGISRFDIGLSDVLVGTEKGSGIIHALRSLSPDIIICDELGDTKDAEALHYALRCGAAMIATVHARTAEDLRSRPVTAELLKSGAFRYVVVLCDRRQAGQVDRIYELRDVYH